MWHLGRGDEGGSLDSGRSQHGREGFSFGRQMEPDRRRGPEAFVHPPYGRIPGVFIVGYELSQTKRRVHGDVSRRQPLTALRQNPHLRRILEDAAHQVGDSRH